MHLKNVRFTYKSQFLKFMIQQKVFKKLWNVEMFQIFFITTKHHFRVFKMQKHAKQLSERIQ